MLILLTILLQAKVVFDADMDSDCDDVAALGVLHALADRGEAEILATISSSTNPFTPRCMDAVNTFYKRPDLPIAASGTSFRSWGKASATPWAYFDFRPTPFAGAPMGRSGRL